MPLTSFKYRTASTGRQKRKKPLISHLILDILSKVGGMLGLFLGGSLFSIIEILYHAFLMFSQITKLLFLDNPFI